MNFNVDKFIENHTISDKDNVRLAMSMPKCYPKSCLKPLKPIGIAKFKGDNMPSNWSLNEHFKVGQTYPIYAGEDYEYPVSDSTGEGMKMIPKAWTKIKFF